jgi:maleylpyruvate isomerase
MIAEASARVARTIDGLRGDDWSSPSLLPAWSRAHVVAHLALNAEAMDRVLRGLVAPPEDDVPRTMYDSDDQRAEDIAELATHDASEIRDRLLGATTNLHEAIQAVPDDRWETRIERTPGGRTMRAGAFPGMRWRELEIHHVDLGTGYTPSEWPLAFAEHLLDAMAKRVRPDQAFEAKPLDSARTWVLGDGESEYAVPVVTGPAADLAWWLTGRPAPDSLSSSRGELPSIEGW